MLSEKKGFLHSVLYLAIIFIGGLCVPVMLEIMTIFILFTFVMPSILFESSVQSRDLFNFSLNRNLFLLLIKYLTRSLFFFFHELYRVSWYEMPEMHVIFEMNSNTDIIIFSVFFCLYSFFNNSVPRDVRVFLASADGDSENSDLISMRTG